MHTKLRQHLLALVVGVAGCVGNAQASFTGLTFFGDSLSDTGNVLSLTTAFAPSPFPNYSGAPGRFSNGPVWTESLASGLGFPSASNPSNLLYAGGTPAVVPIGPLGGQNYSFGGARTGLGGSAGPTTGLFGQLVAWNGDVFLNALTRAADPNALYVLMAGANDMRDFRSSAPAAASPGQTAGNILTAVGLLAQAGAQHFLISNLADLGKTPEAAALGLVAQSTAATLAFNAALAVGTSLLDAQFLTTTGIDLDIRTLDLFGLAEAVYDDAVSDGGAGFGIFNVTTPCIAPVAPGAYFFPGSTDINCAISAYSDDLHPSAAIHSLIGDLALNTMGVVTTVPVPGSLVLVVSALLLCTLASPGRTRPRRASGRKN